MIRAHTPLPTQGRNRFLHTPKICYNRSFRGLLYIRVSTLYLLLFRKVSGSESNIDASDNIVTENVFSSATQVPGHPPPRTRSTPNVFLAQPLHPEYYPELLQLSRQAYDLNDTPPPLVNQQEFISATAPLATTETPAHSASSLQQGQPFGRKTCDQLGWSFSVSYLFLLFCVLSFVIVDIK